MYRAPYSYKKVRTYDFRFSAELDVAFYIFICAKKVKIGPRGRYAHFTPLRRRAVDVSLFPKQKFISASIVWKYHTRLALSQEDARAGISV